MEYIKDMNTETQTKERPMTKKEMAVTIVQALYNRIGEPEEKFSPVMKKSLNRIMRSPVVEVEYSYELACRAIASINSVHVEYLPAYRNFLTV